MTRILQLVLALCIATFAVAGCGKPKGPDVPISQEKALTKSKAQVNLLGKKLKDQIASELQEKKRLDDGRMDIAVNLRNRTTKRLNLEVRTVFKDDRGISTGDETSWTDLYLEPMQSQTYRATSKTPNPESYTVEVRVP
jgi:uncharacterized protein YcfL